MAQLTTRCFVIAKPSDEEKDNKKTYELTYLFHEVETTLAQMRSNGQNIIYMKYKSLLCKHIKPIDPENIPSFWGKTLRFWLCENW